MERVLEKALAENREHCAFKRPRASACKQPTHEQSGWMQEQSDDWEESEGEWAQCDTCSKIVSGNAVQPHVEL